MHRYKYSLGFGLAAAALLALAIFAFVSDENEHARTRHVYIFTSTNEQPSQYRLKTHGPIETSNVSQMTASEERVDGVVCLKVETTDMPGLTATLSWNDVSGKKESVTHSNIWAYACNGQLRRYHR